MAVLNYSALIVWQRAMDLVEAVHGATRGFPREEVYGLTSQLRRASVSIPSNIAEGQGHRSTKAFLRHLSIAHGSVREVETQLLIAERLRYVNREQLAPVFALASETGKLINGLANSLEARLPQ